MEIQELKASIKETMREVLKEERFHLCQILTPCVSDEEQSELEAEFGVPSLYVDDEVIDMTNWLKNGNKLRKQAIKFLEKANPEDVENIRGQLNQIVIAVE